MLTELQRQQLMAQLPRNVIRTLPTKSAADYVDGWYIIGRLNEVFGVEGWTPSYGAPVVRDGERPLIYVPASLTIHAAGITKHDVGVGVAANTSGDSFETAIKSAYTDGLKRCARLLGDSFGLALYEKVAKGSRRSGVGVSTVVLAMLADIDMAASVDEVNAWMKGNVDAVKRLESDEVDIIRGACAERRRELASAAKPEAPAPPPPDPRDLARLGIEQSVRPPSRPPEAPVEQPASPAQREADAWNAAHPVGTRVRYWRGLRSGVPSGEGPTRHAAAVMSDHVSVWIEGCSGSIALSHVEVVAVEAPVEQPVAAPPEVPPALEGFYARIAEIELPGEAVAVWMKHRADLASFPAPEREDAWKALCKRTEEVGKMRNAKVWLKKAITEEDARRGSESRSLDNPANFPS